MQTDTNNVFLCRAFDNCNSTGGYILRNKSQRPLVLLQMTSDTFAKNTEQPTCYLIIEKMNAVSTNFFSLIIGKV